jgi:thermostable 8-oxoguanine DNA glycosylase
MIETNYKLFTIFRYGETVVSKFSHQSRSNCGLVVKDINGISHKEASKFGYKKHIREYDNAEGQIDQE